MRREAFTGAVPEAGPIPPVSGAELFCPVCGYDLRATPGEVCSECGTRFDRSQLGSGILPWPQRRRRGVVRSYLLTVLLTSFRFGVWRVEAGRPLRLGDASRFFWITLAIAEAALLAVCYQGLDRVGFWPLGWPEGAEHAAVRELWDLIVEYRGVWAACAMLWLLDAATAPRGVFRRAAPTIEQAERGAALACYAMGPLFLATLLAGALVAARNVGAIGSLVERTGLLVEDTWELSALRAMLALPVVVGGPLILTALVCSIAYRRFTACGPLRGAGVGAMLLMRWLISAVLLLIVLPCCAGYIWAAVQTIMGI